MTLAVQPDTGALTLALDGQPIITGILAQSGLTPAGTEARQDSPTHGTVHVAYTDGASAVYTYDLDGNDCTLDYALTNAAAGQPRTLDLSGWTCAFAPDAALQGTLPYWHPSYYNTQPVWHPSLQSPLGAAYASDGHTAAVFYAPSEWDRESLLNATWAAGERIPNPVRLELHTRRVVAPGETGGTSLVLRVTDDLGLAGLYGGYKAFLDGKFPGGLHVHAAGPAAQFSSVDESQITPENPHGYIGDEHRLDRPEAVAAYLRRVADPLAAAHGQGFIFWAPGGAEPAMYPPDFDTNLTHIQDTWPALVAGLRARGLRVGLCARPADQIDRSSPKSPTVTRIDPDNARQVATLLDRFRHAARMGIDAYYLDSFGGDRASARLLPAIRQTVGREVPLYTEYCTDATLPYADRYCEYRGGDTVQWDSPEQLRALRFLFPQSVWLCMSRTDAPWPAAYEPLGLTPLIQDFLIRQQVPEPR